MKTFKLEKPPKPRMPKMSEPNVFSSHPGHGSGIKTVGQVADRNTGISSKNSAPVVAPLAAQPIIHGERALKRI